jgi:carbon storage regulator
MLVLSRKNGESICIGEDVIVTIVKIRGDKVRIGIQAPYGKPVHRQEVFDAIKLAGEPIKSFAEVPK